MKSVKVTLAKSPADGQFRVSALSAGGAGLPVDVDVWNLVMQVLRLMDKPVADKDGGFAYPFSFAFRG